MATRYIVLLVAIVLFLPMAADAADYEVSAGFGGQCKMGCWTPVTVRLVNPTGDGGSGIITTLNGMDEQAPYATQFELPASSKKQYSHYFPFEDPMGEVTVRVFETKGRLPFRGGSSAKTTVTTIQNGLLIVVAGPAKASVNFLSGLQAPKARAPKVTSAGPSYAPPPGPSPAPPVAPTATTPALTMFAVRVDSNTLPDRPMGYDGVDVLVLSEFAPRMLDSKQLAALKMWLAGGGTVIVNGGANFQQFQNEFYADILPMDVTGATELPNLRSLQRYHATPLQPGSAVVCSGNLRPGSSVELAQDGRPIVTGRPYGLGRVYFFAFDYSAFPVKGWDGQTELMSTWISESRPGTAIAPPTKKNQGNYGGPPSTNAVESVAGKLPSITTPSFEIILLFMVAYLVLLVPVNYFVLSRRKQRELAWITTPAIILLFTIGAYGMGYGMKGGKLMLRTVTIIESGANARYGLKTSYACLFSPSRRTYDLEVSDPYAVVAETHPGEDYNYYNPRRTDRTRDARIVFAETALAPDLEMDMWGVRSFCVQSGTDLQGTVDATLAWDTATKTLTGTVTNNTCYDLRDCEITFAGHWFTVGSLDSGGSSKVTSQSLSSSGMPAPSSAAMPAPTHVAQASQLNQSEADLRGNVASALSRVDGAVLTGWSDTSTSEIRLNNGRSGMQSTNLFIFKIPTAALKRGGGLQ